jgi:hypothetical protein
MGSLFTHGTFSSLLYNLPFLLLLLLLLPLYLPSLNFFNKGMPATWTQVYVFFSDMGWTTGTAIQAFWIQAQMSISGTTSLCIFFSTFLLLFTYFLTCARFRQCEPGEVKPSQLADNLFRVEPYLIKIIFKKIYFALISNTPLFFFFFFVSEQLWIWIYLIVFLQLLWLCHDIPQICSLLLAHPTQMLEGEEGEGGGEEEMRGP